MNIRKAYHKWMSAFLAFAMMFSIIPVNVFQSTDSTAHAAYVIGGGGGLTGMQTGRWRANWNQNQHTVRAFGAIMHNLRKSNILFFRSSKTSFYFFAFV